MRPRAESSFTSVRKDFLRCLSTKGADFCYVKVAPSEVLKDVCSSNRLASREVYRGMEREAAKRLPVQAIIRALGITFELVTSLLAVLESPGRAPCKDERRVAEHQAKEPARPVAGEVAVPAKSHKSKSFTTE